MPDSFVLTHIRQLPFFAQLTSDQLGWVSEAFQLQQFEPGQLIFRQGEPTQGLYLFAGGRATLIRADAQGRRQRIGVIGANQYLNEAALFKPGVETASLQVVESATVLFAGRKQFLAVVARHPELQAVLPIRLSSRAETRQETPRREEGFQIRPDETVLLTTRRHWWDLTRHLWLPGLLCGLMLIPAGLIGVTLLQIAFCGLALVLPGLLLTYFYLEWRNDQVILTDQRLIHIERTILTMRTRINEINLNSIHEVNADLATADPMARLFHYGTVEIKTAGDAGRVKLTRLPNPDRVQDLILRQRVQPQEPTQQQHRDEIRAEVDRALGRETTPSAAREPTPRSETVYRKHPIFWVRNILLPGFLLLTALGLAVLSLLGGWGGLGLLLSCSLLPIGVLWFYWADWDWRNDLYIVGDDVITLIHRRPLFLQNKEEQILLKSMDNVVSIREGFLQNLFNYGDVSISLIGGDDEDAKIFRGVAKPRKVQSEIALRQAHRRNQEQWNAEKRRREEVAEYISVYHEAVSGQGGESSPSAQSAPEPTIRRQSPPQGQPRPRDRLRPPGVARPRPKK